MISFILLFLLLCHSASGLGIVGDVIDWASDRADKTLLSRCYDGYGCFSIGGKFVSVHRPINLFPFSPKEINTKFLLLTRNNPIKFQEVESLESSILNSTFRIGNPVKFIIHGFLEEGRMKWVKRMAIQLLRRGDFNVISVDWNAGATPPYTQAVANTRLVGAIVAEFIQFLEDSFSMHSEYMHIIGHSLGAHIAGYVGERLRKLGRITGLDPAQPYFEHTHPSVRLDPSDAIFVDVIHTDITPIFQGGFGFGPPCGHIDFYPNGGQKQPGCRDNFIDSIGQENGDIYGGVRHYIGCSHIRAHEYFTESINPSCPFLAVQCSSAEDFANGACFDCGFRGDRCAPFGYHSVLWRNFSIPFRQPVKMYLYTGQEKPYCRYHHRVSVTFADNLDRSDQIGQLVLTMTASDSISKRVTLNKQEMTFQPASTYMFIVTTKDGSPIRKVNLEWKPSSNVMRQLTWRVLGSGKSEVQVSTIEIEGMETNFRSFFCVEDVVSSDVSRSAFANRPCSQSSSHNAIDDKHFPVPMSSVSSRGVAKTTPSSSVGSKILNTFLEKMLDMIS